MISEAFVWVYLPGTPKPVVCGRLYYEGSNVNFVYGRSYRARADAFALAPSMSLDDGPFSARREGQIPGPIADAAPDAWGRRVIEYRLKAVDLNELEYVRRSSGDGIGALHFQDDPNEFRLALGRPATLSDLRSAADALERRQPLSPEIAEALLHGTAIGGARPKAILAGDRALIAKFESSADTWSIVRAEWAALTLARQCGIQVPDAWVENVDGRDVLLVERFDRAVNQGQVNRRHMLSALSLLDLDTTEARLASYLDLADMLRQRARDGAGDAAQLYRRMVYNILIGNTDDHPKNHACFWDGQWLTLTPAYDLVPWKRAGQEGAHGMAMGEDGRASTLGNALSAPGRFGLTLRQATEIVDEVENLVRSNWEATFARCGVPDHDIERLRGLAVLSPAALNRTAGLSMPETANGMP